MTIIAHCLFSIRIRRITQLICKNLNLIEKSFKCSLCHDSQMTKAYNEVVYALSKGCSLDSDRYSVSVNDETSNELPKLF